MIAFSHESRMNMQESVGSRVLSAFSVSNHALAQKAMEVGSAVKKTFWYELCALAGSFVISMHARSGSHLNVVRLKLAHSDGQEFVCVSPYTVPQCEYQFAILR